MNVAASLSMLTDDPLYSGLKQYIVGHTGLAYYQDKDADLAQRIGRRLASLNVPDCAAYLQMLRDPRNGPAELEALISEITIGETYFFRHQDHFDALRDVVLPEIIARNSSLGCLRIWCAGCADGSEPYSLSILLKNDLANQLAGWEVTILGTDINRRCLERARAGKFEDWALRSTPEDVKRNCFIKEGKSWTLAPQYRESVCFEYHNLAEDRLPPLVHRLSAFDLIVCRNVTIYFGPGQTQRIVQRFHDCLVPGGWLLVGPAEPNMTYFTSFRVLNAPGVTLYQKERQPAPDPVPGERIGLQLPLPPESGERLPESRSPAAAITPAVPDPARAQSAPAESTPAQSKSAESTPAQFAIAQSTLAQSKPAEPTPAHPTIADIRRHADGGAWESAVRCCEQLLELDTLNSDAHFYHALILEHTQRPAEAERSLRQAIYLDRTSVLPHYYQGLFLQSRGDRRQAARSFENTLDLLRTHGESEILPNGDGISVADLKKLAQRHLEILLEQP